MKKTNKFLEQTASILASAISEISTAQEKMNNEIYEKILQYFINTSKYNLCKDEYVAGMEFYTSTFNNSRVRIEYRSSNGIVYRDYNLEKILKLANKYIEEKKEKFEMILRNTAELTKTIFDNNIQFVCGEIRKKDLHELCYRIITVSEEVKDSVTNYKFSYDMGISQLEKINNQFIELLNEFSITVPEIITKESLEETYKVPTIAELEEKANNNIISNKDLYYIKDMVAKLGKVIEKNSKCNYEKLSLEEKFFMANVEFERTRLRDISNSIFAKAGAYEGYKTVFLANKQKKERDLEIICNKIIYNDEVTNDERESVLNQSLYFEFDCIEFDESSNDYIKKYKTQYKLAALIKEACKKILEGDFQNKEYAYLCINRIVILEHTLGIISGGIKGENVEDIINSNLTKIEHNCLRMISSYLLGLDSDNSNDIHSSTLVNTTNMLIKNSVSDVDMLNFSQRSDSLELAARVLGLVKSIEYSLSRLNEQKNMLFVTTILKEYIDLYNCYDGLASYKFNDPLIERVDSLLNELSNIIPAELVKNIREEHNYTLHCKSNKN